jgi:hypothetical protein
MIQDGHSERKHIQVGEQSGVEPVDRERPQRARASVPWQTVEQIRTSLQLGEEAAEKVANHVRR